MNRKLIKSMAAWQEYVSQRFIELEAQIKALDGRISYSENFQYEHGEADCKGEGRKEQGNQPFPQ